MYWVLPPILLYVVVKRCDMGLLAQVLVRSRTALLVAGVLVVIPIVLTGALRWYVLLRAWRCTQSSFVANAAQYWISLVIGFAAPGALGSDVYRALVAGHPRRQYLRSATVIAIEKLAAIGSCALLIGSIYPFVHLVRLSPALAIALHIVYVTLALAAAITLLAFILSRHSAARHLASRIGQSLERMSERLVRSMGGDAAAQPDSAGRGERQVAAKQRVALLGALALSVLVQVLSATQAQLFFVALGYQIPYLVNLFIGPILFLLFALPISFGSIGIREGAYILAYGAFGVPAEIALIVSFCSFAGLLISYAIGALLLLVLPNEPANVE
jgi:uncharacterized protein (TIRG00374 family)